MRDLRKDEVEFTLEIEPEDQPIDGNASAWGDGTDEPYWAELNDRVSRGDDAAWCIIVVKATWTYEVNGEEHEVKGWTSLGGCTIGETMLSGSEVEREAWIMANDHDMRDDALADLNRSLRGIVGDAKTIESQLVEP